MDLYLYGYVTASYHRLQVNTIYRRSRRVSVYFQEAILYAKFQVSNFMPRMQIERANQKMRRNCAHLSKVISVSTLTIFHWLIKSRGIKQ